MSFNFNVTSNGTVITGSLTPQGSKPNLTMLFSDGLTTLVATPAKTITLIAGTDINPQSNFIYITKII